MRHDEQLEILIKKVSILNSEMVQLGKMPELGNLIEIMKYRKGWTTIAELAFAETIVDAMQDQVSALRNLNTKLLVASERVELR